MVKTTDLPPYLFLIFVLKNDCGNVRSSTTAKNGHAAKNIWRIVSNGHKSSDIGPYIIIHTKNGLL